MSDQIQPWRPRTLDEVRAELIAAHRDLAYYQNVASEWILSQPPEPLIVLPGMGLKIVTLPQLPDELQNALVEGFERMLKLEYEIYQLRRGQR